MEKGKLRHGHHHVAHSQWKWRGCALVLVANSQWLLMGGVLVLVAHSQWNWRECALVLVELVFVEAGVGKGTLHLDPCQSHCWRGHHP